MWSTTSSTLVASCVDVLAVERRDVLRVQELDQVARDRVALVLSRLHLSLDDRRVRVLAEAPFDQPRGFERVRARLREQVVELGRPGNEATASSRAGWYRFTIRTHAGHICALALAASTLLAAAPAAADTGVLAIGDFGVGGRSERADRRRRSSASRPPGRSTLLVTLGDNDYTERPAAFRSNWRDSFGWAFADGILVAGTLGNHDVRVDRGRYEFGLLGMPSSVLPAPGGRHRPLPRRLDRARRRAAPLARRRSRRVGRAVEGRRHAPPRLQLRRLPRRRGRPATPRSHLRAQRRRPRPGRARPQLPALRGAARRHVRLARRRRGRALLAPRLPRLVPAPGRRPQGSRLALHPSPTRIRSASARSDAGAASTTTSS